MNSDVSYLEDCPVPCLPGRTHCLHQAAMGLPRTKAGLSHFADQHFDGPNKLHVCCHCWMTAGQDADGVFHFPVNPERDTLRAEVAALKAQIDQQHEDLDHFLSGAVDDLPKIAALRKDAERYRWLKSLGGCVWDVACPDGWRSTYHRHDQMDAAIDAALADKQEQA